LIARITLTTSPCSAIKKAYLAATDTVLAGAGAFERQRPMDHSLVEPFSLRDLYRVIRIEHEANLKTSVAGASTSLRA
jgi:hypothetical protein